MRRYWPILALLAALPAAALAEDAESGQAIPPKPGKVVLWKGDKGSQASAAANWSPRPPTPGDQVLFDGTSPRDCDWDLALELAGWTQDTAYRGTVRLWSQPVTVRGALKVSGGTLDLQGGEFTALGRSVVETGGLLELGRGVLKLGPQGLRVETNGTLSSTGSEPAFLRPATEGKAYMVRIAGGALRLSNAKGTVFEGTRGLMLNEAQVESADHVRFVGVEPNRAAVSLAYSGLVTLRFTDWSFDDSAAVNVDASKVAMGSNIVFADSAGAHAGFRYAKDPGRLAAWEPEPTPEASAEEEVPFAASKKLEEEVGETAFTPFVAAQFMGGQYFFGGTEGGLSGNLNVLASSVIKHDRLGPQWSVIPLFSSRYQGTKQVTDLVGGGTLFQELADARLAVRGVFQPSKKWKIKPEAGYKRQFLKETRDEDWGKGLFDYERPNASVEAEYLYREPFSLRFGYDFYHIGFPNYTSLESQIQEQEGSLARELAGKSTIDSDNHAMVVGGSVEAPWKSFIEASLAYTFRRFPDQHIVSETGDLITPIRKDVVRSASASWRFPRQANPLWKLVSGASLGIVRNNSNQNSYDAQRTTFLKDYYNSTSLRLGLELSAYRKLSGDRPLELRASAGVGRVSYPGRRAQDESGLYGGSSIHQTDLVLGLGMSYPIAPHFKWSAHVGHGRQSSNQDFEKLYRYNFNTTNYLVGFSYEY